MERVCISKTTATLVTCAVLALGTVGPAWATSRVVLSPYAPFPKAALTAVGASLARPTHAQVASVRVSVSRAYAVALTQAGNLPKGAKVKVRLGLFSDAMQGKKVGMLSYAFIFDGVDVPSYGPIAGPGGHELVVIVNADTGRSVEAFSYR
jgi:hypothetical protein